MVWKAGQFPSVFLAISGGLQEFEAEFRKDILKLN